MMWFPSSFLLFELVVVIFVVAFGPAATGAMNPDGMTTTTTPPGPSDSFIDQRLIGAGDDWRSKEQNGRLLDATPPSSTHPPPEHSSTSTNTNTIITTRDGRELSVYALYNLDTFAVEFTTVDTTELQDAYNLALAGGASRSTPTTLVSETGQDDSTLSYPLRSITQNFLYGGFLERIQGWEQNGGGTYGSWTASPTPDPYVPQGGEATGEGGHGGDGSPPPPTTAPTREFLFQDIYSHLVTVDIHVKLYVRNDDDGGPEHRRQLQSNSSTTNTSATTTTEQVASTRSLLAEMYPTIAFLELTNDTTAKPSDDEVSALFGGLFMTDLFTNHRDVYLRELVQSRQELLQEITKLTVALDIDGKGGDGDGSSSTNSYAEGWSDRTERALLTILIVVSVAGVIWMLLYWRQRRRRWYKRTVAERLHAHGGTTLDGVGGGYPPRDEYHDEWDEPPASSSSDWRQQQQQPGRKPTLTRNVSDQSKGDRSHADHSFVSSLTGGSLTSRPPPISTRQTSLDSVRHGQDVYHRNSTSTAVSALEATDRYLSRHRPDLYYDQHHQTNSQVTVFGRNYEIPANPFDYIYKGYFQQPPPPQQSQMGSSFHTPTNPSQQYGGNGSDGVATATTFPFLISPRGAFTPSGSSTGGGGASSGSRRSSFTVPSPLHASTTTPTSSSSSFTPIGRPDAHNLMAAAADDDDGGMGGIGSNFGSPPTQGTHTGQTWQDNQGGSGGQGSNNVGSDASGVVANIWRNLSMSSWYNSNTYGAAGSDEEIQYHDDPSLMYPDITHGDIELEDLEDGDYEFPFMDFPRHDGTPCLIFNEDALLKERHRRAPDAFVVDTSDHTSVGDDGDIPAEKKTDDRRRRGPLSNEMFQRMLSQNSLAIDDSSYGDDDDNNGDNDDDGDGVGVGRAGSTPKAKSPAFQKELSRLLETKQRRYAMEFKKNDIMEEHRKKRKQVREQERRERHKAMEKEIEEIEAEFLTDNPSKVILQQPLSPVRIKVGGLSGHSPKAPRSVGATSSRIVTRSPARLSGGLHSTVKAASSPYRRHGTSDDVGDMFRRAPSSYTGPGGIYKSASIDGAYKRTTSPPGGLEDFEDTQEYKLKVRPVNLYGSDMFGAGIPPRESDELTMPALGGVGPVDGKDDDDKYRSPQSAIDELMQPPAASSKSHPQRQIQRNNSSSMQHRRTRTPTKPAGTSATRHHSAHSFDIEDPFHRSRIASGGSIGSHGSSIPPGVAQAMMGRQHPPSPGGHRHQQTSPTKGRDHRRSNSSTPGHKRTSSQHSVGSANGSDAGRGGHHRSGSQQSGDVFLHGVVAQTRFI